MNYHEFLLEFFYSPMAVTGPGIITYKPIIQKLLSGEPVDVPELPKLQPMAFGLNLDPIAQDAEEDIDQVAVIPIRGLIMKYGRWWHYGAEEYAEVIQAAMDDDSVKAIILSVHSPGGATSALFPFKQVLAKRTKPVIGLVDNMASSMGYWLMTMTDEIIAIDRMAQVGSIGVFARLIDDSEMLKQWGIKEMEIYPPESSWKNKPVREALNNKTGLLEREELTPMALEFQNAVKTARPKLDMDVEGIIEGRVFYAFDAVENGLIDSIMPFDEAIQRAFTLAERQSITQSLV